MSMKGKIVLEYSVCLIVNIGIGTIDHKYACRLFCDIIYHVSSILVKQCYYYT